MATAQRDIALLKRLQERIALHGSEEVEIEVAEKGRASDTTVKKVKKERVLLLLDQLFELGLGGNVYAIKEYLDRQLGKPKESIDLTNDGNPFNTFSDAELISRVTKLFESAGQKGT